MTEHASIYFRSLRRRGEYAANEYPFTTALVSKFERMDFTKSVTIFCGENGCGKSTLLEIIAEASRANRIGWLHDVNERRAAVKRHLDGFSCTVLRARKNFFFTAEDFVKYIEWLENEKKESLDAIREIDETGSGRSAYALGLAKMPHMRELYDMENMYRRNLSGQSHGEGFLDFFKSRISERGLYLLDEPEGALSYENQYYLSRIIMESVKEGGQFIIATHSPIITAIPNADLVEIRDGELFSRAYDEISNNSFLRAFVTHRDRMMREDD